MKNYYFSCLFVFFLIFAFNWFKWGRRRKNNARAHTHNVQHGKKAATRREMWNSQMKANIHALETCVSLFRDPSHSLKIAHSPLMTTVIAFCCSFGSCVYFIFFPLLRGNRGDHVEICLNEWTRACDRLAHAFRFCNHSSLAKLYLVKNYYYHLFFEMNFLYHFSIRFCTV